MLTAIDISTIEYNVKTDKNTEQEKDHQHLNKVRPVISED